MATNRLVQESSLYLRQHADNPVDWYAWGPDALKRAKELDRPIFLSIGYSACHWCHVMANESFEDERIGKILNEHFVSIKVDREERPDIDSIYMAAVQALNQGQGGWPMSVFLTPDLEPFFAGTYYPPEDHYGRPGFARLLQHLARAWEQRRDEIKNSGKQIAEALREGEQMAPRPGEPSPAVFDGALKIMRRASDPVNGGLGNAPKFPRPIDLRLQLRLQQRGSAGDALSMVTLTLDKMARGGMYDQLGGGFHRYSTDARWLVPHFEKMLYDNALLARAYLDAYRSTNNPFYKQVVEETLDFVVREMRDPNGGFYSTLDADSEGVEGEYYVWGYDEFRSVVGDDAERLAHYFDVSERGNFEQQNILNVPRPAEMFSKLERIPEDEWNAR